MQTYGAIKEVKNIYHLSFVKLILSFIKHVTVRLLSLNVEMIEKLSIFFRVMYSV